MLSSASCRQPGSRRPWVIAISALIAGIAAIWTAVTPLLESAGGSVRGSILSTVGLAAITLGLNALRRNRVLPNLGILVMAVVGIGSGVIGTAAMVGILIAAHGSPAAASVNPVMPAVGGPGQQIASETTRVKLSSLSVVGDGRATEAVVGNGGSVRLDAAYAVRSTVLKPTVAARLERRATGGAWTSTGVRVSAVAGSPLVAATPQYSTQATRETVQYRFASADSVSAPVTVIYENQAAYTGMAATIYAYAAPYCPTTAVHVEALSGKEAGRYRTGALLIEVDSKVGRTVNLSAASQRAVALHECSHERQWLNYGGTEDGFAEMKAAAAKYFTAGANGAIPLEHAADCGAMALEPNGYLGYGGYCTSGELTEGARLLQGQMY